MKIHHEGYKLIAGLMILVLVIAVVIYLFLPVHPGIKLLVYGGLIGFMVFVVRFFRYNVRDNEAGSNDILCPADGKIVVIEEVENAEYFGDKRIQISIFMSPYDIHVNWIPMDGTVVHRQYYPGKYLVAWHPKSSLENERTSVVIERKGISGILVRQIAGAMARRIVCYPEEGKLVKQGEELGFIKFGSRVDVLLPANARVQVKLHDKVKGRETILAKLSS